MALQASTHLECGRVFPQPRAQRATTKVHLRCERIAFLYFLYVRIAIQWIEKCDTIHLDKHMWFIISCHSGKHGCIVGRTAVDQEFAEICLFLDLVVTFQCFPAIRVD